VHVDYRRLSPRNRLLALACVYVHLYDCACVWRGVGDVHRGKGIGLVKLKPLISK
jgi:hypothetical protein